MPTVGEPIQASGHTRQIGVQRGVQGRGLGGAGPGSGAGLGRGRRQVEHLRGKPLLLFLQGLAVTSSERSPLGGEYFKPEMAVQSSRPGGQEEVPKPFCAERRVP